MSGHMQGGSKMDAWAAPLFILQVGVSSQPPSRSVHLTGLGAENQMRIRGTIFFLFCCSAVHVTDFVLAYYSFIHNLMCILFFSR